MTKPSEMTNAVLADWLDSDISIMGARPKRYKANLAEAAKRLRAMPEPPKPEFCVGWAGKTRCGEEAEIFGEYGGRFFGRIGAIGCSWDKGGNRIAGIGQHSDDLLPPEPEIWHRPKSKPDCLYATARSAKVCHPGAGTEKVEVRVADNPAGGG